MDGALALVLAEIEGLESLNVYRSQFPGRKIIARHRENLVRTGILAAAVLVLMFASVLIQPTLLSRRVADLDQLIASVFREAFPDAKKVADPYQQMQINMQELKKNAALPGETLSTLRSIEILKSISDSIPTETAVVLERMVLGPDSILISGTTAAFNAVDEIKGHLERVAGFKKVTDAGQGPNALTQAQQFHQALGVTGFVLTKLVGTDKGGIVLAIANRLGLPLRFVGVGESAEDFGEFDAETFVDAVLAPGRTGGRDA